MTAFAPRTRRSNNVLLTLALAGVFLPAGCSSLSVIGKPWELSSYWHGDYDSTEQQAGVTGREMFFFFKDTRAERDKTIEGVLKDESVRARLGQYERCLLFRPYEPDRRYAAQYGVERAPALIIVRADGTYHSLTGLASVAEVLRFLDKAKSPGDHPAMDPFVLRAASYVWHDSLDSARAQAERENKPILLVLQRSLTRDGQKLEALLSAPESFRRFCEMIPCRLILINPFVEEYITQFGVVKLPAIILINRDGNHAVLEMPTSVEGVVQFADRNKAGTARTAGVSEAGERQSGVSGSY